MAVVNALETLTPDECRELLTGADVGRIAFSDRALPAIVPVCYGLDDDGIVIRTSRDSRVAAAATDSVVAFEVDDVEVALHAGRSVVVTGRAEEITDHDEIDRWSRQIMSWAPGQRDFFLRIPMTVVSGRRVGPRG